MGHDRDRIRMTEPELARFLASPHKLQVATLNADGSPHVTAMYYAVEPDGLVAFWAFQKSQKAVNLRRDPRIGCLAESGEAYAELRGVQLTGTAELVDDYDAVVAFGKRLWPRYFGPVDPQATQAIERTARKRILVRVAPEKIASWDHAKLATPVTGAAR